MPRIVALIVTAAALVTALTLPLLGQYDQAQRPAYAQQP